MSKPLEGRVAVVTGAGRGIGRAIGIKLAQCGAFVALVDLSKPSESAALAGASALAFAGDVSSEATWAELAEAVERAFGRLDIVVNNAAVFPRGVVEELDYDAWRRAFAVNLDAHFFSAKHCVPRMRKNGYGRFIAISSNSIGIAEQALSAYMATKMGAIGFMHAASPTMSPPTASPAMRSCPLSLTRPRRPAYRRRPRLGSGDSRRSSGWRSRRTSLARSPFSPARTPASSQARRSSSTAASTRSARAEGRSSRGRKEAS